MIYGKYTPEEKSPLSKLCTKKGYLIGEITWSDDKRCLIRVYLPGHKENNPSHALILTDWSKIEIL